MPRLDARVVLLMGAGSIGAGWGIGKAAAVQMAREGARVFAVDLNPKACRETCALIAGEGGEAHAHTADATLSDQVAGSVAECLKRYDRIDILVNNVGGSAPGGPVEMSEEVWDAQIDRNLKTAFLGCKHVLPVMLRQGHGAIVNVASIAGMRLIGLNTIAYAAGKAGLIQFSRAVAIQHAAQGIRCNTVVPGFIHTPLAERRIALQHPGSDPKALIAERGRLVPMRHMGNAWDVAHAIVFLASDEARYITATEVVVDGGLTATSVATAPN